MDVEEWVLVHTVTADSHWRYHGPVRSKDHVRKDLAEHSREFQGL